ncbi:MAG: hypothetical protein HY537_13225 [Deltaproteobacteria bacterium]|nr:hypothetical protein [Deltaproteobacteria bacterium]
MYLFRMSSSESSTLIVVGTPLNEGATLGSEAVQALKHSSVLIGESRSVSLRLLKSAGIVIESKTFFFLDHLKQQEWLELKKLIETMRRTGGSIALFADGGMPILFDPGKEILSLCRNLGFSIHSVAGPMSWSVACAMSGWDPPFLVEGFLPRKTEERMKKIESLKNRSEKIVLMDTPYRFRSLIDQLSKVLETDRKVFLAWEIGNTEERFVWESLGDLRVYCDREHLRKGEFILIVSSA